MAVNRMWHIEELLYAESLEWVLSLQPKALEEFFSLLSTTRKPF